MVGLVIALLGFMGAAYIFLEVQVLSSYPFYGTVYGPDNLLPGLTYTEALEVFGIVAAAGLFTRGYTTSRRVGKGRSVDGLADVLLVLGVIIAIVVYTETHLMWGEVLPGVHFWGGLPGGGGYPWGSARVAYNLCLIPVGSTVNCNLLNYDELFWIAVLSAVAGYVMKYR